MNTGPGALTPIKPRLSAQQGIRPSIVVKFQQSPTSGAGEVTFTEFQMGGHDAHTDGQEQR